MKKIQIIRFLFVAIIATLFSSCAGIAPIPVPGSQLVFGQGGGGQPFQGYQQQQFGGGGYQNPQQQFTMGGITPHSERCYVKLGADAPKPFIQMVETAAAAEVQSLFAKSCLAHDGQRGEWPDINQVNKIVSDLFKSKGYNLTPSAEGSPGGFKVMEYKPGLPPG